MATGGKYDVYCPDGWVWKGTTSASKAYTCLENGTYISSNPDEESTIVVIDDCEDVSISRVQNNIEYQFPASQSRPQLHLDSDRGTGDRLLQL